MRLLSRWISVPLLVLVLAGLAGCYSVPADGYSDQPWNSRQGWEGSPYIPGLSE